MAWCPQCKNEYREGIKICSDCGSELVEEEQYDEIVSSTSGEENELNSLKDALGSDCDNGVIGKVDEEGVREFTAVVYSSSTERAEENRSSAWTLLVVGGLGLLAMLLGMVGVIPWKLGNPYMFYGVMSAVFLLFIVMGLVSVKNARIFAKKAESENSLKDTITEWYRQNLTAELIDAEVDEAEEAAEEILYFKRIQIIRDKLNHQFINLDQVFLEHLIDEEIYDSIYSEKI